MCGKSTSNRMNSQKSRWLPITAVVGTIVFIITRMILRKTIEATGAQVTLYSLMFTGCVVMIIVMLQ